MRASRADDWVGHLTSAFLLVVVFAWVGLIVTRAAAQVAPVLKTPTGVGAQAEKAAVEVQAPQGYMPTVVLVRKTLADDARVCVERPDGALDCRRVGELRKWAMERAAR